MLNWEKISQALTEEYIQDPKLCRVKSIFSTHPYRVERRDAHTIMVDRVKNESLNMFGSDSLYPIIEAGFLPIAFEDQGNRIRMWLEHK